MAVALYKREEWIPPMQAKYLTVPKMEIRLSYPDDAIKVLPSKQRDEFYKKLNDLFGPEGRAFRDAKAREIQRLIIKIETQVAKLAHEGADAAKRLVAQANEVLAGELKKWEAELRTILDTCVQKAYAASFVAMKQAAKSIQIRSVVTIVLLVAISLGAAWAALTAGDMAMRSEVIAAAKVLWEMVKLIGPQYVSLGSTLKKLEADLGKIKEAYEAQVQAKKAYATPLEKVAAIKAAVVAPLTTFNKDFEELDKFEGACNHTLRENGAALAKLKATHGTPADAVAKITECENAIARAKDDLAKIATLRANVADMKHKLAAAEVPNFGALQTGLTEIRKALPVFEFLKGAVEGIVKALIK
jgi:hypothetical protein